MDLKCKVQTYDWGKYGIDSTVATLMKSANSDFVLDEKKPYAELWIGTHPNGPSYMKDLNISLEEFIKQNSEVLGSDVLKMFGQHLPFLFKVLSVNKALSIQVHPHKVINMRLYLLWLQKLYVNFMVNILFQYQEKARELHQQYSTIYKDANHKPELAIALTPFEALCGFRPIREIKEHLQILPELQAVIGKDKVLKFMTIDEAGITKVLKTCFHSLMTCEPGVIALQLRKLLDRLSNSGELY